MTFAMRSRRFSETRNRHLTDLMEKGTASAVPFFLS